MPLRRLKALVIAVTCAVTCAVPCTIHAGPAAAEERTLAVYNWNEYIDTKVLDDFTRETGIKVTYDTYDSIAALSQAAGRQVRLRHRGAVGPAAAQIRRRAAQAGQIEAAEPRQRGAGDHRQLAFWPQQPARERMW
jgi:spermidine/putrescine-binding protein